MNVGEVSYNVYKKKRIEIFENFKRKRVILTQIAQILRNLLMMKEEKDSEKEVGKTTTICEVCDLNRVDSVRK